jgi:hypothetical protein
MLLLGEAVSAGILRTNLVILTEVVLIILSVDIREVMEHMYSLPMLQIQMSLGIITTVPRGMRILTLEKSVLNLVMASSHRVT